MQRLIKGASFLIFLGMVSYPFTSIQGSKSNSELADVAQADIPEFDTFTDVNKKKKVFFGFLKPMIENENNRVLNERRRLKAIQLSITQNELNHENKQYAARLARLYNYHDFEATNEWVEGLLLRVNVIPDALVYVQGAMESGWGTSRFAVDGNNFFGQWCYTKGCGLVPQHRNSGATHEVALFNSPQESVHAYFMNLNRNRAYSELREIREYENQKNNADLRSNATALELTQGLLRYSERKEAYVEELNSMIEFNEKFWE